MPASVSAAALDCIAHDRHVRCSDRWQTCNRGTSWRALGCRSAVWSCPQPYAAGPQPAAVVQLQQLRMRSWQEPVEHLSGRLHRDVVCVQHGLTVGNATSWRVVRHHDRWPAIQIDFQSGQTDRHPSHPACRGVQWKADTLQSGARASSHSGLAAAQQAAAAQSCAALHRVQHALGLAVYRDGHCAERTHCVAVTLGVGGTVVVLFSLEMDVTGPRLQRRCTSPTGTTSHK